MTTGAAELPPGQAVGTETSRRRAFLFGKSARIASRQRFEALWDGAAKRVGRYVVAWSDASETAESRLGVVASKRTFRHAVDRNRVKRLLRESYRLHCQEFTPTSGLTVSLCWMFVGETLPAFPQVEEAARKIFADLQSIFNPVQQ